MKTMIPNITARVLFAALLAASGVVPSAAEAAAPQQQIPNTERWSVLGFVDGFEISRSSAGRCLAAATYGDGVVLSIVYDVRDATRTDLAIENPAWRSIEVGKHYAMVIDMGSRRATGEALGAQSPNGSKGFMLAVDRVTFGANWFMLNGVKVTIDGVVVLNVTPSNQAHAAMNECAKGLTAAASKMSASAPVIITTPSQTKTSEVVHLSHSGSVRVRACKYCPAERPPVANPFVAGAPLRRDATHQRAKFLFQHRPRCAGSPHGSPPLRISRGAEARQGCSDLLDDWHDH